MGPYSAEIPHALRGCYSIGHGAMGRQSDAWSHTYLLSHVHGLPYWAPSYLCKQHAYFVSGLA